MAFASEEYLEWKAAHNKDDLWFFGCGEFRSDYTRLEMRSKARMFEQQAMPYVRAVLSDVWSQTQSDELRILSLGCGPGSDLLGILRAVGSVLRTADGGVGRESRKLKIDCIGVDAFDWNRDTFYEQLSNLDFCGKIDKIRYGFIHQDMGSFGLRCLRGDLLIDFDFICLSFADAGRNLELVGTALPHLLSEFGRILVLDNDIPTVRRLADYGFTRTFRGYNVCMHSGNRSQLSASISAGISYHPPADSPIQLYRKQKMLDEFARIET